MFLLIAKVSDRPCRNLLCLEGAWQSCDFCTDLVWLSGSLWGMNMWAFLITGMVLKLVLQHGIEAQNAIESLAEATAIGKNSKSVTDFLEKKCPKCSKDIKDIL